MSKVNPLGLSTGGTPIPETNDGASNFVRKIVKKSMNNNAQHAAQPQPTRPPLQPGFMGPLGGMRELRVEDALLYLDDVKREFGGRPCVYDEFLAIIKNFKSHKVDTPEVIARESKLFHGNNCLILDLISFYPTDTKSVWKL
jgi:histone deacetylase complex regulatory component SIN3